MTGNLTKLEREVLKAIATLQPGATGVTIRDHLSPAHHSFGKLFAVAERLENKGLIVSRYEASTMLGGWRQLFFRTTIAGNSALDALAASRLHKFGLLWRSCPLLILLTIAVNLYAHNIAAAFSSLLAIWFWHVADKA